MKVFNPSDAFDPRRSMTSAELRDASRRAGPEIPVRSRAAERLGVLVGSAGVCVVGVLTLLSLTEKRASHAAPRTPPPAAAAVQPAAVMTPPPTVPTPRAMTAPPPAAAAPPAGDMPVLILDQTVPPPASSGAGSPGSPAAAPTTRNAAYFTADEQFAGRAGEQPAPTSQASRLVNPARTVAQGAFIAAVLETAVNSDLPGYARAIVSQDVRSFDRSAVLIPRGSRLVGEYKSAAAIGQSRAFIVWTRVLRPDGVSVQLGSPATDELGQAGLAGKVDRHLLERYGGAILLTTVNGLASSLGGGSTVVLGSTGDGSGAASALQASGKISPTIRAPQGTPIQVFVARDLDFSEAGS